MTKRDERTPEERDLDARIEHADYLMRREAEPVSRGELLAAIDKVRANFGANGFETSDLIARAFEQLAGELE